MILNKKLLEEVLSFYNKDVHWSCAGKDLINPNPKGLCSVKKYIEKHKRSPLFITFDIKYNLIRLLCYSQLEIQGFNNKSWWKIQSKLIIITENCYCRTCNKYEYNFICHRCKKTK